jgi:hypothetical protein
MRIRIRLTDSSRQAVVARLHSAYQGNQLRLVKRIHALLAIVEGESVTEVAALLHLAACRRERGLRQESSLRWPAKPSVRRFSRSAGRPGRC